MDNIVNVDLNNKVVLNVDDYINLLKINNNLENEKEQFKEKYINLVKYLVSECDVKKYTSGKKYLDYDTYNNHLGDYLKAIEPEAYQQKINESEVE